MDLRATTCFLDGTGEKAAADTVGAAPIAAATNEGVVVEEGAVGGVVTSEGGGAVVGVVTDGKAVPMQGVVGGTMDGGTALESAVKDETPEDVTTATDAALGTVEMLEGVTTDGMELLVGVAADGMEDLDGAATEGMQVLEMADGKEEDVSMPVEDMETAPTDGVVESDLQQDQGHLDVSVGAVKEQESEQIAEQPLQVSEHPSFKKACMASTLWPGAAR